MLGHIPQAQLIPISELPYAFRVLNRNEDVVVLCQHGIRSIDACYFLEAQGFDRIYNLIEGMSAWTGEVELDTQSTNS
jgi:rhodanese-related sulfurtransferase